MSFPQIEHIIVEQLEADNYRTDEWREFGIYHSRIVIPKTGRSAKIEINCTEFRWSESGEYFTSWFSKDDVIDSVYVKSFLKSQRIHIHGKDTHDAVRNARDKYWEGRTREVREQRTVDDGNWAGMFNKVLTEQRTVGRG